MSDTDNTIPPDTAIPLEHPWCPPDRPYPESYAAALAQDPARCIAFDPCSGDGETTLWKIQPCATATPPTTATVSVIDPPVLPRTGVDVSTQAWGLGLIVAGALLVAASRRRHAR